MSKSRKTIRVSEILDNANRALASESYGTAEYRHGIASMLETVLHATGNYQGFNYLGWLNGGADAWLALNDPRADKAPYIGDETRRRYYATQQTVKLRDGDAMDPKLYPKAV